jgi:pimeloyl-ACP methyl ester carboxylesterase
MRSRRRLALLVAVVVAAATTGAACTSSKAGEPVPTTAPTSTAKPGSLTGSHRCAVNGFTCSMLTVSLDRGQPTGPRLSLNVAVADNTGSARGVLLMLTGGPGQPGAGLLERVQPRIAYLLNDYRLVMIDQRGTGNTALNCPDLQREVGSSDILPPSPAAVRACADALGTARDHYTTTDTVADLEQLRIALGVDSWTVDGISYGTYVAQRYAYAHPDRVRRMVLDSVVPATGAPATYADSMHRTGAVLRQACAASHCSGDPTADVARLAAAGNGADLMNFIVTGTIVDPTFSGNGYYPVLDLVHRAVTGDPEPLNRALVELDRSPTPTDDFSAGLHAATLCAEVADPPWGRADAPLPRTAAIPPTITDASVYPFTRATVTQQGLIAGCRFWPPTTPPPPITGKLAMPVLMINGDRDLSTPLPWAQADLTHFSNATLSVVAGMGHSIQGRNPHGDAAVREFLLAG